MKRNILVFALLAMGFVACVQNDKERNDKRPNETVFEKMESQDSSRISAANADSIQAFLSYPVNRFSYIPDQWVFTDQTDY